MPTLLLPTLMPLLMMMQATQPATAAGNAADADALARQVMQASGADVWPRVTRIRLTFNVEREGKRAESVQHDWDVRAGTDTVTWNGKNVTVDITRTEHDGDQKQAYARFINDSYWLLAPLKVMDPGVNRSTGEAEEIDGQAYELLHLSFDDVGLTPTDRYNLWIDRETKLVRYWDYIPAGGEPRRASWEDYRDFNGLKLALNRVSGNTRITFTDVEVTVD